VLILGEEDGAPARARQLRDGVEEEIEDARKIETRGQRLGELLGDLGQLAWRDVEGRPLVVEGNLGADGRARGAKRGHLLEKMELLLGLAQHRLQVQGGEGMEEDEVRFLRRCFVVGRHALRRQYAH